MNLKPENIEDLPNEMLTRIFRELNGWSLLQLAESTKTLRGLILSDSRFLNRTLLDLCHCGSDGAVNFLRNRLQIQGLKPTMQYLRIFGSIVLELSFNENDFSCDIALKTWFLINRYAVNAQIINFKNVRFDLSMSISQPFYHLRIVTFQDCYITKGLGNISEWAPNVQRISFYQHTPLKDLNVLLVKFERLVCLDISKYSSKFFSLKFIIRFHALNPTVKIKYRGCIIPPIVPIL